MSINWNNAAERTIEADLGMIPEVGTLLSVLVSIFWPKSGEDVWSQIKDQVEQLIQKDISQEVYQDVQNNLNGLQNDLQYYVTAAKHKENPSVIGDYWITADSNFGHDQPNFQSKDYQLLLLPLFAQFANLNLSLLRDGVLFGKSWGWDQNRMDDVVNELNQKILEFTKYVKDVYEAEYFQLSGLTAPNLHTGEPFRTVNAFVRQMTLGVLDFANLWPYFAKASQPDNPIEINLNREIYSDPVGTANDSGLIMLPSPPTLPISQFTVWGGGLIDAVQLAYPEGGGPNGVTVTARMGDQPSKNGGGSNQPPHGGVFDVSNNPVSVVTVYAGDVLNALQFDFIKGGRTRVLGTNNDKTLMYIYSYPREVLSSIHINGVSTFYGTADCAVFGFKYEQSQKADLDALRHFYIASPSSETINDLAARCVTKQVAMDQLSAKASAESWDAQRAQYWEYLEARKSMTHSA